LKKINRAISFNQPPIQRQIYRAIFVLFSGRENPLVRFGRFHGLRTILALPTRWGIPAKVVLHYGKSSLVPLIKVHDIPQQKELSQADFDFMTALMKTQIEKLIRQNVIQHSLFDENISEIILQNDR
jgi:hypothetical protein